MIEFSKQLMKNLCKNLRKRYEKLMTTKRLTYDKYGDEMAHLHSIIQEILNMNELCYGNMRIAACAVHELVSML